jgi:SAM-dependent methyltransferase
MAIETPNRLLGTAARIAELFEGKLRVVDQFGPEGAHLYDYISRGSVQEIDEILQAIDGRQGPLLELCCGNGRTTLPMLEKGYEIVGLDLSPHMLDQLRQHLEEPKWQPLAGNLTLVEGDMSSFDLGRQFNLIVLGMSTVWVLDAAGRASLFRRVKEHLAEGGRFLVTLFDFPWLAEDPSPYESTTVFIAEDQSGAPLLCTLYDRLEPADGIRGTAILAHRVAGGAVTDSSLYVAWTNLISIDGLEKEIEASGLRVLARHPVAGNQLVRHNKDGRRKFLVEATR